MTKKCCSYCNTSLDSLCFIISNVLLIYHEMISLCDHNCQCGCYLSMCPIEYIKQKQPYDKIYSKYFLQLLKSIGRLLISSGSIQDNKK